MKVNNPFSEKDKQFAETSHEEIPNIVRETPQTNCIICGKPLPYHYSEVRNTHNPTVKKYCSKECRRSRNK